MSVKLRLLIKKGISTLGSVINTIGNIGYKSKRMWVKKLTDYRLKRTDERKAIKIATKIILRDVIRHDYDTKFIVIAKYVDTMYGLSSFNQGGNIGEFKGRYEKAVYEKYILNNQENQIKVFEDLETVKGLEVIYLKESDVSKHEVKGFVKAISIDVTYR